ncbi:hypothetical protein F2Q69_00023029 [Brassica cretica]|uniref:RING-type E3 ubiquitin transferase n=1 Tax=Brassica cretica TaxID=69181 RepID=A0A8S9QFV9_BRACR|nr:hypothetical protein F2Q69_00023029 [Brassica cretica]
MIDPQKSIALDSASVMASDRKTEKEVSADSATSLLSEEAMAQEEEQLLKLREDEEKAKYLFFSFFLMKAKKVVTAKKSTDEARRTDFAVVRQQTEDKTDAENISGIGFSLLVSLEVHQRLPLHQITLIFVSFTVHYFAAAAGCGVYETNRPIIIEICVCTLRKCLTGEPFITLYHVVIIVMYLAAASCLSSELELLALSERIGTVNTGLTEEDVKSHLKTRTCSVINLAEESPSSPQTKDKTEPCTICKKRMKAICRDDVPQEAFMAVLKLEEVL